MTIFYIKSYFQSPHTVTLIKYGYNPYNHDIYLLNNNPILTDVLNLTKCKKLWENYTVVLELKSSVVCLWTSSDHVTETVSIMNMICTKINVVNLTY